MKRVRPIHERGKKFAPLRVKDSVDSRMAACGGDTRHDLRLILEIAAVGKANREAEPLGLAVEVLVVGVRVDPAKDRVLRLALAAVGARLRADRKDVTCTRALLKAGRVARQNRKRRLVYAPRLAVPKSNMRLFSESSLVLLLEICNIMLHDSDEFLESAQVVCHLHLIPFLLSKFRTSKKTMLKRDAYNRL